MSLWNFLRGKVSLAAMAVWGERDVLSSERFEDCRSALVGMRNSCRMCFRGSCSSRVLACSLV